MSVMDISTRGAEAQVMQDDSSLRNVSQGMQNALDNAGNIDDLDKAAKNFEAFFVGYVMEMAYKSIPKSDFLGSRSQEDMFQSMFIQESAKVASEKGDGFGLAKMLVNSAKHKFSAPPSTPSSINSTSLASNPVPNIAAYDSEMSHANSSEIRFNPGPLGRLSSDYGERVHPISGRVQEHDGVDVAMPMRTPVRAAGDGEVKFSGELGGYGRVVIIEHANGFSTLYGHNDENSVEIGQKIRSGEVVGYSGNTGLSTGPHLHFEVRKDGKPINPESYIIFDKKV